MSISKYRFTFPLFLVEYSSETNRFMDSDLWIPTDTLFFNSYTEHEINSGVNVTEQFKRNNNGKIPAVAQRQASPHGSDEAF